MRRSIASPGGSRAVGVLVATFALAIGPAVSAMASVDPEPEPSTSSSPPDYVPTPTIDVSVHSPICDGDVPYLQYAVEVEGTDNDTVDITWVNPDGEDVVQSDLPLTGRVLWPGAEVDSEGKPLDWPGWHQEADGEWVVGDEFDWVRNPTQVEFEVNPTDTVTVAYPPSSPQCATNPPGTTAPTIKVKTLTPICVAGVSYLDYVLEVTGTPNNTTTLTWHNPTGGADYVQADLPLTSRVLWPGAFPERFVDLPAEDGWELVNNMWMNTRDFGWATGNVDLTFAVNPEVTVTVTYPQDTSRCFPQLPPDSRAVRQVSNGESLAATGAQVGMYVAAAIALLGVGTAIILIARRSRRTSHQED